MSNPNPIDELDAARKLQEELQQQAEVAKARVDKLEREAAVAAAAIDELPKLRDEAASKVPNFAALEAALLKAALANPERFDAPDGEFIDTDAPKRLKLTLTEMEALTRLRNGSLRAETLTGVIVFVDDKLDILPRLTDEQKQLVQLEKAGHLTIRPFEGTECVFDDRLVKARQQLLNPTPQQGAGEHWGQPTVVAGPVPDPTPPPGAGDPQAPPQPIVVAQSDPQPIVTGESGHPPAQSGGARRRPPRGPSSPPAATAHHDPDHNPAPSGAPSQAPGDPMPGWGRESAGGSYRPHSAWQGPSLAGDLLGSNEPEPVIYPPATQTGSQPEPKKPGGIRKLGRRILGDYS